MSLIKKLTLNFLLLFLVFCLFFKPCLSADILNITISDLSPTLEVLQGKCRAAPFYITNLYNETVNIYYRIDKPSDMNITSYPKDYTLLTSGETIAGNLNVCVNEYFENDTYNIKFWIDTFTKVNESRVKSDKYTLGIVVLNNPNLKNATTTSIASETTTTKSQVISTIPVYTPITSTTIRNIDININVNKPKNEFLLGKEKLATVAIIIIALVLIMLPYLTFMKSQKKLKDVDKQSLIFKK
jgi:hypothetical protein